MFLIPAFLIYRPVIQGALLSREGEKPGSSVPSTEARSNPGLPLSRPRELRARRWSPGTAQPPAASSARPREENLRVPPLRASANPPVPCPARPSGAAWLLPACPGHAPAVPAAGTLSPWPTALDSARGCFRVCAAARRSPPLPAAAWALRGVKSRSACCRKGCSLCIF